MEAAATFAELHESVPLKKLSGTTDCYRLRLGEHRVGVTFDGETITFVRCLHRRAIYRYFP